MWKQFEDVSAACSGGFAAKRASAAVFPASVIAGIEPLLAFNDVSNSEKMNLFISKLSLCCVVFDFFDPTKNVQENELKRATLVELVDFVSETPPKFSEPAILASCKMCCINLFRVFPPKCRSRSTCSGENENDDEHMFEPAWSHLQLVYEYLLKFVTSSSLEAKAAKKYVNNDFISRIIDLLESDDPRAYLWMVFRVVHMLIWREGCEDGANQANNPRQSAGEQGMKRPRETFLFIKKGHTCLHNV